MMAMAKRYYTLPFDVLRLEEGTLPKIGLVESIRQHISLLLSSMPGSYYASPYFGTWLNKQHFQLPDRMGSEKKMEQELKDVFQENLKQLIGKYEPRLQVRDLEVKLKTPDHSFLSKVKKEGKLIFEIQVTGLILGKEEFSFVDSILLK
jgi:predicted component of type VI protein secretion system